MQTSTNHLDPAATRRERRLLDSFLFGDGDTVALEPEPPPAPAPIPVWSTYPIIEQHLPPGPPPQVRREDPLPAYLPVRAEAEAIPSGSVSDGSGNYELASLAPGLYEIRHQPAPPRQPVVVPEPEPEPIDESSHDTEVELTTESLDVLDADEPLEEIVPEECIAETLHDGVGYYTVDPVEEEIVADESPAAVYTVEACTGAAVTTGDSVVLSRTMLRLAGPDSPFLIDIMLLSPPASGVLLRDGFALTGGDVFTQEDVDHGRIVYRHDPSLPGEADAVTVATAGGEIPELVFPIEILSSRRPPELIGCGTLEAVLHGCRVRQILDGAVRRDDGDPEAGMAVVGITGRGQWEFSLDGGVAWSSIGGVGHANALLLAPTDFVRFTPFEGWSGDVRLSYRAWDRRVGLGGSIADMGGRPVTAPGYSREVVTATASVEPRTTVPNRSLPGPWQGGVSAYEVVGSGMAVVRLDGPGTWQYSTDGGASWQDVGPMYHGRALLLKSADRLRMRPRKGSHGKVTLGARVWDGRGGAGGSRVDLAGRQASGEKTPFAAFIQTRTWQLGGD